MIMKKEQNWTSWTTVHYSRAYVWDEDITPSQLLVRRRRNFFCHDLQTCVCVMVSKFFLWMDKMESSKHQAGDQIMKRHVKEVGGKHHTP